MTRHATIMSFDVTTDEAARFQVDRLLEADLRRFPEREKRICRTTHALSAYDIQRAGSSYAPLYWTRRVIARCGYLVEPLDLADDTVTRLLRRALRVAAGLSDEQDARLWTVLHGGASWVKDFSSSVNPTNVAGLAVRELRRQWVSSVKYLLRQASPPAHYETDVRTMWYIELDQPVRVALVEAKSRWSGRHTPAYQQPDTWLGPGEYEPADFDYWSLQRVYRLTYEPLRGAYAPEGTFGGDRWRFWLREGMNLWGHPADLHLTAEAAR